MPFTIGNKSVTAILTRNLGSAQRGAQDALEKLSSGKVFTRLDPKPAERALAESLEFKMRGINASKRTINDAVSLVQTAESGLEAINNMVLRMKEINLAASNSTISDQDRKYLFIEFAALRSEVDRIAETTTYNSIKLLNGADASTPDTLTLRLGDPTRSEVANNDEEDINVIKFDGLKNVIATANGLSLPDVRDLLGNEEGINIDDVMEMLQPEDDTRFTNVYDEVLDKITMQRAVYGGMQARMRHALDYAEVYEENLAAAKSSIADTDYASEVAKLTSSRLLTHAATAMLVQSDQDAAVIQRLLG